MYSCPGVFLSCPDTLPWWHSARTCWAQGHRGTAAPLSCHRAAGQTLDSVGNRLKARFSSLELHGVGHNMSWSDGQASSTRASHTGWRCPQQLPSSASSAGSRPVLVPKHRLLSPPLQTLSALLLWAQQEQDMFALLLFEWTLFC